MDINSVTTKSWKFTCVPIVSVYWEPNEMKRNTISEDQFQFFFKEGEEITQNHDV